MVGAEGRQHEDVVAGALPITLPLPLADHVEEVRSDG